MTSTLALDVGSSSVKAAVLVGVEPASPIARAPVRMRYDGVHAEVDGEGVLRAMARAARQAVAENATRGVDVVAIATMAPSWLAMDARGRALTPVITHQDRRALEEARIIERRIGRERHLELTGNRPIPGGISSTTALHFHRRDRGLIRRADLVGHLSTFLLRRLTGARVIDPGNASFTGLYQTTRPMPVNGRSLWIEELVSLVGLRAGQLPVVLPGDAVAGELSAAGARVLGLPRGTPVLTGVMDASAAIVLGGAAPGSLFNVCGTTDVLAAVTTQPRPDERYLTRHLGVGGKWLAVTNIAASGAALVWARQTFFTELEDGEFYRLARGLARRPERGDVRFDPHLAGSRLTVEQPTASLTGLRLSTTRRQILSAIIESLAEASAARIPVLRRVCPRLSRQVLRTGGAGELLGPILHRNWKGRYRFHDVPEATLLGLGRLACGLAT